MLANNHHYHPYNRNNFKKPMTVPSNASSTRSINTPVENEVEIENDVLPTLPYQIYSAAPNQRLAANEAVKWTLPENPSLIDTLQLEANRYLLLLSLTVTNSSDDLLKLALLCNDKRISAYQSLSLEGQMATLMITLPLSNIAEGAQLKLINDSENDLIIQQGSLNLLAIEA